MKNTFLFLFVLATLSYSFQKQATPAFPVIEMVRVKGGSFQMGTLNGVKSERPVHEVKVGSFAIGKYEITQAQWQAVMGSNPSHFKGCDNCPVEEITLAEVDSFISKLNRISNSNYRLPTEAEWEYAALGGPLSKGYCYPGSDSLEQVAWMVDNAGKKTHPVGQKKPNELGLYDMSGNVWELCSDYWNAAYYKTSPAVNPRNDTKAVFRVTRGGSWRSGEERCYSKARNFNAYDHYRKENFGLRLVIDEEMQITLPR
ncbi:MAG TPA: formylglycine-generating enzyme family protein [Chitinophagales bacterium]|nr:formylglycine-generating enzyme family protein [Chitinophagales bacterium]